MEKIGKFTVLRPLATGGMASLFLVKRNGDSSDELFVIKRVLEGIRDQKHHSKLFAQEAKLSMSFNHPNVVRTIEVGSSNDNLYIVQEYIDGHNLKDILQSVQKKDGIFPSSIAYHVLCEAARGLAYLHGELTPQGKVCIHKDISPHNIMVSRLGAVKLIDFGISKTDEPDVAPQSEAVQGKYSYMSPEQARGDELTAASDVFALAVIFYELISGLKFYGRNSEVGIIRVLDEWSDKDVQVRLLDIPNPTHRELLGRALARDPKQRPKASEFLELFTQELTSYEEELTPEALEKNLKYCLSEHRNKEVYGALPVVLVDGVPDLQNVTESPFPTQFTLYDVLTEEKRSSRLWAPLLAMSFIGLFYVGQRIFEDPDKILGIGRQPSSTVVTPPAPQIVLSESLLLRIPDVGNEAQLQVNLNGRDLDATEISEGIKVFDGDNLIIRTQAKPGRKWKEHSMVIDTKAPPQFNFNL